MTAGRYIGPGDVPRLIVGADGTELRGWQDVTVTASLDDVARAWTARIVPRTVEGAGPLRLRPGAAVVVALGADPVCAGYLDATSIQGTADGWSVTLRGRSATAELVDCAAVASPGRWRGATLGQIARECAGRYGVDVVDDVPTESIRRAAIEPGETVSELLDRMAESQAVLLTDDAQGRLVITRVSETPPQADAPLVVGTGGNVLEFDGEFDASALFSEIVCKGQRAGDTEGPSPTGTDLSALVGRLRTRVVRADARDSGDRARQRARWEMAARLAAAWSGTYTVLGWRQTPGGRLWGCGELVRVIDPYCGVDTWAIVAGVTYTQTGETQRTTLRVVPPATYRVGPVTAAALAGVGPWGGGAR